MLLESSGESEAQIAVDLRHSNLRKLGMRTDSGTQLRPVQLVLSTEGYSHHDGSQQIVEVTRKRARMHT